MQMVVGESSRVTAGRYRFGGSSLYIDGEDRKVC